MIEKRGITLVSLIITIVLLLIIGAVSIKTYTKTDIFKKSQDATKAYAITEKKELTNFNVVGDKLDTINKNNNKK